MMKQDTAIKLFEDKKIRTHYDEQTEEWYFSVIDVVEVLTDSANPRDYWFKMKQRVKLEDGIELSTICRQLKMIAPDGKMRSTDCANVQSLLRIIQSIPSPKAEPFKQWLAKVGYERIQETRNKLTDYWKASGVNEQNEFAALTNIIHQEWTGLTVKQHKTLKNLKTQNLRDHMSEAELIFTALAELSTRQIAESEQAKGFTGNATASKKGGKIAKNARKELEAKTGKSVVTGENFLPPSKNIKTLKE
jgi:prophage antirepressor-like protein